jgi:peptidyl-dipeptidase Dcp
MKPLLNEIVIRTRLLPGDLGFITWLHATLYQKEYGYGISFEAYVAQGLAEFYQHFDAQKDRVWVCEYGKVTAGFLLLMHRDKEAAQLRFFLLQPEFRNIGLGKKLMQLFMEFLETAGYRSAYLWTTHEQEAAAALYKKFGFVLQEERPSTAFGKPLTEQRYEFFFPSDK